MALGGYTKYLLEYNPTMAISGITLPQAKCGHPVIDSVIEDSRAEIQYFDMDLVSPFGAFLSSLGFFLSYKTCHKGICLVL